MAASALRAKNKGHIEYDGASRGEVHRLGGDSIALGPGLYLLHALARDLLQHAPAHFLAPLHRNVEDDHARVGVAEVVLEPHAHVAWVAEAQEAEAEHREQ